VPLDGGNPVTLATADSTIGFPAVNSSSVFWPVPDDNAVYSVPITGGRTVTVVGGQQGVNGIAVNESELVWQSGLNESTLGMVCTAVP
jgi:hypothetical protein